MTESKKKPVKKEKVENIEDEIKPPKKAKVKEIKEKPVKQVVEEEILPVEEEAIVSSEAVEKNEEMTAPAEEEVAAALEVTLKEKKFRKTINEPEEVKEIEVVEPKAEVKIAPSAEDFDWESFESEELKNTPKHKEYEALYDETLSTVAVDEVVNGMVIQMTPREVVINIGYNSEGGVSLNEFRYNPNLKVGDTVEVYVESQEAQ